MAYDITQIDSLVHDTTATADHGSICKMDDAYHFFVVYAVSDNDVWAKTFEVDASFGNITFMDDEETDSAYGDYMRCISPRAGGYNSVVIRYAGSNGAGTITHYTWTAGTYVLSQKSSLAYDNNSCDYGDICWIDDTHIFGAWTDYSLYGVVECFRVSALTPVEYTPLIHDNTNGSIRYNSVCMLDSTHAVVAYASYSAYYGIVKTFSIDGSYNVTELDDLTHDTNTRYGYSSVVAIDSTHFILAYADYNNQGHIKTFSVDGSYVITQIDDLVHETTFCRYCSLVKMDNTHFILHYSNYTDGKGICKVFEIDGSYEITEVSDLVHDTAGDADYSQICMLDDTHFALVYTNASNYNVVKTFLVFSGIYNEFAESCSYSMAGEDIDIIVNRLTSAEAGGYDYTGEEALVTYNQILIISIPCAAGEYYYTGGEMESSWLEDASAGTYTVLGGNAVLRTTETFYANGWYYEIKGDHIWHAQPRYIPKYKVFEIDSHEHDSNVVTYQYNSMAMIDSTHFILAYKGNVKTFAVDTSYDAITEIDSLANVYQWNSILKIDSTHFILASSGGIQTLSIDAGYDNITEIDALAHDTYMYWNHLLAIDSTHFILAYDNGSGGHIKTFSIDGSYNITEIDDLEHNTSQSRYPSFIMIDGTHFMLAYAGDQNDGFVKTFSIDGGYNVAQESYYEHNEVNGTHNSLGMIDGTHFLLSYTGNNGNGYAKVITIDENYDFVGEVADFMYADYETPMYPSTMVPLSITGVDGNKFVFACATLNSEAAVKIFVVDGGYNAYELINSVHHEDTYIFYAYNSLINVDDEHFIVAYSGPDDEGIIKTFRFGVCYTYLMEAGLQSVTGFAADLGYSGTYQIETDPSSYSVAGVDADLIRSYAVPGDSESYAITGYDASPYLDFSKRVGNTTRNAIYRYRAYLYHMTFGTYYIQELKSFQIRWNAGSKPYLSVVVNYDEDALPEITLRSSTGLLFVDMVAMVGSEEVLRDELMRVSIDSVRTDKGGSNGSITITGYSSSVTPDLDGSTRIWAGLNKIELTSVQTETMLADGRMQYRCSKPIFYLRPNDMAYFKDSSFTVGLVSLIISPDSQVMTVSEQG